MNLVNKNLTTVIKNKKARARKVPKENIQVTLKYIQGSQESLSPTVYY